MRPDSDSCCPLQLNGCFRTLALKMTVHGYSFYFFFLKLNFGDENTTACAGTLLFRHGHTATTRIQG